MRHVIDFSRGSIVKSIVLFSLPIVAGELLQNLYNSVDALVVCYPLAWLVTTALLIGYYLLVRNKLTGVIVPAEDGAGK